MNGNQNVWGPGIILARRVMNIGDNLHVLLSDSMAEPLIALKDEYKMMLKSIGDYQIKQDRQSTYIRHTPNNLATLKLQQKCTRNTKRSQTVEIYTAAAGVFFIKTLGSTVERDSCAFKC
jgi:hypothetical protein